MALRRILRSLLPLLLFSASATPLFAQATTSITATSVNAGGNAITGRICFTAVDAFGNAIPITKSGGGFYKAGAAFCQNLSAGALSASLSLPNTLTDHPTGHGYAMVIYDQNTGLYSDPINIFSIGGSSWSLDTYIPPATTPTTPAFTFTTGSGSHPSSCTAPAIDVRVNSGVADMAICSGGSFVEASSASFGGGSVPGATSFGSTVTLAADPSANLQAATKQYVDAHSSGAFNGGTVTNPFAAPSVAAVDGNFQMSSYSNPGGVHKSLSFTGPPDGASQVEIDAIASAMVFNVPPGGSFTFSANGGSFGNGCMGLLVGILQIGRNACAQFAGAYSSSSTYDVGTIVTSGGTAYISLIGSNHANTPAASPSDWQPLGGSGTWAGGAITNPFSATIDSTTNIAAIEENDNAVPAVVHENLCPNITNSICQFGVGQSVSSSNMAMMQYFVTPSQRWARFSSFIDATPTEIGGSAVGMPSPLAVNTGEGVPVNALTPLCATGIAFCVNPAFNFTVDNDGDEVATSIATTGSSAGSGLTVTPNGTDPTPPANSIVYTAPQSVPTPYDFEAPTNVTSAASSALPLQCQFFAAVTGPPATPPKLVCSLTSSGSGLPSGVLAGVVAGTYDALSLNNTLTSGSALGILGDTSGSDKFLYLIAPSTGGFQAKIANVLAHELIAGTHPTTCPGSGAFIEDSAADGYRSFCNAGTLTLLPPGGNPGSGTLPSVWLAGNMTGAYYGLSFNGTFTTTAMSGFEVDSTSTDPTLYVRSPGPIMHKIANVTADLLQAGNHTAGAGCSGHYFTRYAGDGYETWCDGTTEQVIAHP